MVWPLFEPEPVADPAAERAAAATKKKWIIAGVVLALLLIVVLIIVLCLIFLLPKEDEDIGEQLKKNMNLSADPCHDFYNYACGGWIEAHKNSKEENSTFTILMETNLQRLLGLLEAPNKAGEASYKTKVKRLFTTCTNEERRKERGTAPFLTLLKKYGPFPIMEQTFDGTNINMQNLLTRLTLTDANPIFHMNYQMLHGRYVIHIETFSKDLKSSDVETRDALRRLGVLTGLEDIESQIQGMFSIQANLSQLFDEYASIGDLKSIQDLQHQYSWRGLSWLKFLQDVTGNATLNTETMVHVSHPGFLDKITEVYFTQEYSRDLVNYLMKNLLHFTSFLDPSFMPWKNYTDYRLEKLSKCFFDDGQIFSLAVSCMYVDEYYTHDYAQNIADMMSDIKEAYRQSIHKANLGAHKEEQMNLNSSINLIKEKVGLIESLKDEKHLNYLNSLLEKVTSDEFFEMKIELVESVLQLHFKSIQEGTALSLEESRFIKGSSLKTNVFHIDKTNYIAVPAASLQPPLINPNWPSSLNYGAIGSLLGREILLALTVLAKSGWLNPARAAAHINNCVFSSLARRPIHGSTLETDVKSYPFQLFLDVQGVQASFMAYQIFRKSRGDESPIKGLDLNHNQLFFLGYTQMMCQFIPGIMLKHKAFIFDTRALISLMTSKDFAEAYNCKTDAQMNSIAKCDFFVKYEK